MFSRAKLLVLALVLLASAVAFGQSTSGDVIGTVLDKSGAVVAGATVTAVNQGTGVTSTATTSSTGEYRFGNLPIGKYNITATAKGFATATVKDVTVELNKTLPVRFNLSVASVSTQVEVTEAAAAIDTATAQLQSSYDTKLVQDMPTASVGSGVLNLSLLQAGVGTGNAVGAGSGPSVGGQRPRNNNFTVEGVDNNDKGVTGPVVYVPNDAVAEFTVMTNQFSPEFGHSTGGQFNSVLINGTNTFHGRAYEYFQNRNLNAVDYTFSRNGITNNPRYDNNRFGGQIGGPIIKNKLFFFFNMEYNPLGQESSGGALYAPTSAGYTTLLGLPGVSTANVNGLKSFAVSPASCSGQKGCPVVRFGTGETAQLVDIGELPIAAPNFQNTKALATAVDYNMSNSDQIRARYIWNKIATIDTAAALPVFFTNLLLPYDLIALSEYHTFNSNVNNELRVGYNRTGYNYTVPGGDLAKWGNLDMFPNLTIDDLGLNVGPDPNAPQYAMTNTYQMVDNVTWVKGNHTFKFGLEARKAISPQLFIQRMRGDYEWASLLGFATDAVPDFAERSLGNVGYSGDNYGFYSYFNDQWKVNSHLTVNLGLRHEYNSTPYGWLQQKLNAVADAPGLITFGAPQASKKQFMPRVGFAYSPGKSGNTSIRGGFGMGYDVMYDNIGTLSRPPEIGATTIDCPGGAGCPTSNFLANGAIKPFSGSGTVTYDQATARALTASYLPNEIKAPYSIQWNLGVQHVFATNYTADIRYVGTRGVHLDVQNRLNIQDVVTANHYLPTFTSAPSQAQLDALTLTRGQLLSEYNNGDFIIPAYLNAGFDYSNGPIVGFMPLGSSSYHGLQTQLDRRFSNGLQFRAAWTWSHTIDNSTADFFSTIYTPRRQQDFQNLAADKSNSALSRAHRITLSAIYDVPFFKSSKNWMAKNIVGNWQISPIYTYETGEWATVQSGVDSNLNGDSAGDRAIVNKAGVKGTGSGVSPLCNSGYYTSNYYNYMTANPSLGSPSCGGSIVTNIPDLKTDPTGETFFTYGTNAYVVAYGANNPNAYYIQAGQGARATDGRNSLLTRPINNVDLTLMKRINLTERYRVEFAMQALNTLNHPQFVLNSINDIASGGSTSSTVQNMLKPSSVKFNKPQEVLPSNSRALQLYLKFIF